MAYKGPEIKEVPPGWVTIEQLRDNLVEYMMVQSPYKELAKEDMPPEMIREMEKSMTRLAIAIWHAGGAGAGPWTVYVNEKPAEVVSPGNDVVDFKEGPGIKVEYLNYINSVGKDLGQIVKISLKPADLKPIIEDIVNEITHTDPPVPPEPQDPYFIAVCINNPDYDQSQEVQIPFSSSQIRVQAPTKAGDNFIFFSTPDEFGPPTVLNSLNKDISYQFTKVGPDVRTGYKPNSIWKRNSTYGTSLSTVFFLTV